MNEEEARALLKDSIVSNGLQNTGWYLSWHTRFPGTACLDGDFTAKDLEAIAWWMQNKGDAK